MKFASVVISLCLTCYFAESKNIVRMANELGATTLVSYIKTAGLKDTLKGTGPFTVFGPTNDAFDALPDDVKQKLTNDKELLKKVLLFHVTSGKAYSSQLSNNLMVQSLDPALSIRVNIYGDTNKDVTVDGAKVVKVDQNASNGVIHVIDKVMFPLPSEDIPNTIAANKELSTLLEAVKQGQLAGPLAGTGPFTLFAPSNAAFQKLPPGALNDLLNNKTALVDVLKYHVISACAYSAGLSSGSVQTLEGKTVNIEVSSASVTVNNAKVVIADVPTNNGVIHEIDSVLLPPK